MLNDGHGRNRDTCTPSLIRTHTSSVSDDSVEHKIKVKAIEIIEHSHPSLSLMQSKTELIPKISMCRSEKDRKNERNRSKNGSKRKEIIAKHGSFRNRTKRTRRISKNDVQDCVNSSCSTFKIYWI